MSSDAVRRVAFGDLVDFAIGGGWGSEEDGEIPVTIIRGTDFAAARHGDLSGCPRRFESRKRADRRTVRSGDILLEISGGSKASGQTTGRSLLVSDETATDDGRVVIPASFCRLIRLNQQLAHPRYVYYHLQEMYQSGRAGRYENQSTGISNFQFKYFLENEQVRLPALSKQEDIAEILGSLDGKIENNRRLARTLEDIAAALFKARFVDFVARDDLVESKIGSIPRGWQVVAFSDAVEVNPTVKAIKKGSVVPHIGMADVPAWGVRPTRIEDREYSGGARFEPGDTLMARITGCIEHGKGAFVDFLDRPGAGSTEFLVFRARLPLTPEMVFLLSRTARVRDHAIASMSGSSGRQRVQTAAFDHIAIAVPPDAASVEGEANVFRQVFKQTRALWRECQTLGQIRDLLLPRLMSGRIRVEEGKAAA